MKYRMLTKQSTIEEIETHIEQMSILLIEQKELETIDKLLFLEELLKDDGIQRMIKTDLNDDTWDYQTQVLINSCKRKKMKAELIKEHINKCYDFLILRHLEERSIKYLKIQAERHETAREPKWVFICYPKQDDLDPVRWANAKFMNAVEKSSIKTLLEKFLDERDNAHINEKWVMENRHHLYNEDIFTDINTLLEKRMHKLLTESINLKNNNVQVIQENREQDIPLDEIDLFAIN